MPSIQISETSGNFHALVIKKQNEALKGYRCTTSVSIDGQLFQIGIAKNRVRANSNIKNEYPELHNFKEECEQTGVPIIYLLGAARQFIHSTKRTASRILHQTREVNDVFGVLEATFGNNVIIGTGGWAGTIEQSFGIPRMGYLHAVASGSMVLTTMPHAGKYDRHENPTLEVFCGPEWGDDSSALAAACNAALIFPPFGTWTKIELANLQAQKKTIAVVDNPKNKLLNPDEQKRKIKTEYGEYWLFDNAANATNYIVYELKKQGYKKAKPFSLTIKPGQSISRTILEKRVFGPNEVQKLQDAYTGLIKNLAGDTIPEKIESWVQDLNGASTVNAIYLIVEQFIHEFYKQKGQNK